SSIFTIFLKYLIPAGAILSVIVTLSHDFNETIAGDGFDIQSVVLFGLAAAATSILFVKLQFAEANKEHILLKIPFSANKKIQYEDIEWVYQVALLNPALTVIKYKDIITKRHHTFFIASGEMQVFGYLKDNEMTKFVRNQIIEAKPDYKKENEPNKWKPMVILYGIFIIAQLLLFNAF
ncbi:MAG: hypothetical protein HRT73_16220, partial [Flavobacteriales bacterium]|nr:hypothetical protein [Flavobacteriales bacterium]